MNDFRLTDANYHSREANMRYFSCSQVKAFDACEAAAMAEINGTWEREETPSLLIGSYVDAYFNSKRSGDKPGKISGLEFSEFVDTHRKQLINSRTGELKADFKLAEQMIERAENDKFFMSFLSGRKQVIMTANLFGVPFKVKFDVLRDDYRVTNKRIVDVKTVRDMQPMYKEGQGRLNFIEYWQYDLQGAIYTAVYEINKGLKLPFYIAPITKENPPDLAIIHIPQEQLDMQLKFLEKRIDRYRAVKVGLIPPKRCGKCAYCRKTNRLDRVKELSELDFDLNEDSV